MKCSLGISNFLEEISSLSHSVVFLYFFALIAEESFLISPCYSLELYIQMLIFPSLLCFSLLFFSQLFVRPPQRAILLFCISFPWGWKRTCPYLCVNSRPVRWLTREEPVSLGRLNWSLFLMTWQVVFNRANDLQEIYKRYRHIQ